MPGWMRRCSAVMAVFLLAACADEPPPPPEHGSRHVSPAAIPPATMPPGTFSRTQAEAELARARAERLAGRPAQARQAVEASLDHWPESLGAWRELLADCQAIGDADCAHYAAFFHDKVEFVAPLSPRVAVLGFQTMRTFPQQDGRVSAKGERALIGNGKYDPATLAMARRLEAFFNLKDEGALASPQPREQ